MFYGGTGILAAITLAALIIIVGYILVNGLTHINFEFLTQEPKRMGKEGGIFSVIIGTLMVTGVGILIATPIGIAAAIYFTEYAKNGKWVTITMVYFSANSSSNPSIFEVATGSRAEVGSSIRITSGSTARHLAMHSLCCCPPESPKAGL